MRDGMMTLGVGLVFGHSHVAALAELLRAAAHHRVRAVRPAPGRTVLLTGVSALNACGLTAAAERLGFVVHAGDPRRRIAACPGAPACASGLIPARALAARLAPDLALALGSLRDPDGNGVLVHISGCPKGCAHPAPAALTLVGAPQGCGVVYCGTAGATPHRYIDPAGPGRVQAGLAAEPLEAGHG
jgi:precorrin-3B synthase